MILGKRVNDDNSQSGFTKWPFMTTHAWAENPRGVWKLHVIFDSDEPQEGTVFEWTLLLHGTRQSPYIGQNVDLLRHSKLAVVKRQHEIGSHFQF